MLFFLAKIMPISRLTPHSRMHRYNTALGIPGSAIDGPWSCKIRYIFIFIFFPPPLPHTAYFQDPLLVNEFDVPHLIKRFFSLPFLFIPLQIKIPLWYCCYLTPTPWTSRGLWTPTPWTPSWSATTRRSQQVSPSTKCWREWCPLVADSRTPGQLHWIR